MVFRLLPGGEYVHQQGGPLEVLLQILFLPDLFGDIEGKRTNSGVSVRKHERKLADPVHAVVPGYILHHPLLLCHHNLIKVLQFCRKIRRDETFDRTSQHLVGALADKQLKGGIHKHELSLLILDVAYPSIGIEEVLQKLDGIVLLFLLFFQPMHQLDLKDKEEGDEQDGGDEHGEQGDGKDPASYQLMFLSGSILEYDQVEIGVVADQALHGNLQCAYLAVRMGNRQRFSMKVGKALVFQAKQGEKGTTDQPIMGNGEECGRYGIRIDNRLVLCIYEQNGFTHVVDGCIEAWQVHRPEQKRSQKEDDQGETAPDPLFIHHHLVPIPWAGKPALQPEVCYTSSLACNHSRAFGALLPAPSSRHNRRSPICLYGERRRLARHTCSPPLSRCRASAGQAGAPHR
ncbi:hypothetical protein DSECCO2_593250 [anaerobic digester metagenome]